MRAIKFDFQPTSYKSWHWIGIGLLTVSVGLNALLVTEHQRISRETSAITADIYRIEHPRKEVAVPEDDITNDKARSQLKEAGSVISHLNLPWPALLRVLEDTREPKIDLLEVSPNLQAGNVQIVGQSENLKSTFDYITRLKKSGIFSKVELNDHEKMVRNGVQVLKFTISASWLRNHE